MLRDTITSQKNGDLYYNRAKAWKLGNVIAFKER
jgi:hypothetical protein